MSFENVDSSLKDIFNNRKDDQNDKMNELYNKNFHHVKINPKEFKVMKTEFKEKLNKKVILEKISGYSIIKSRILIKEDFKLLKEWLGSKSKPKLKLLFRVSDDGD